MVEFAWVTVVSEVDVDVDGVMVSIKAVLVDTTVLEPTTTGELNVKLGEVWTPVVTALFVKTGVPREEREGREEVMMASVDATKVSVATGTLRVVG